MTLSTRRSTGPDLDTVMLCLARDGYRCVRCSVPIQGDRGVDWVLHHRRPRAMGGSRRPDANSPANLISLCAGCHLEVESHRAEAFANGWLVQQFTDPTKLYCLVEHGSRVVYLTTDGQYADKAEADDRISTHMATAVLVAAFSQQVTP